MRSASTQDYAAYLEDCCAAVGDVHGNSPGAYSREEFDGARDRVLIRLDTDLSIMRELNFFYASYMALDTDKNGQIISDYFTHWRTHGGPSVPAMMLVTAEKLDIDIHEKCFRAAIVIGICAEIVNDCPYHNNAHFREVMAFMIRNCVTNNELVEYSERGAEFLDGPDLAKCMLAAAGHDLRHDGSGNAGSDGHTPYRLEQYSFDLMQPYLSRIGLEDADLQDIRIMVLITDVTADKGGISPLRYMRSAYFSHFHGMELDAEVLPPELASLASDARLAVMCALMSDSDLGPSAGTNYAFNQKMTILIGREDPAVRPGPHTTIGFSQYILEHSFTSTAGRTNFQLSLERILRQASGNMLMHAGFMSR